MSLPAEPADLAPDLTIAAPIFGCRAVLFDMDGTLVDSTAVVEEVWGEFAGMYGLDIEEILRTSHGVPAGDTVRRFAPEGSDVVRLTEELGRMERSRTGGIVPIPGASALIGSLPAESFALVTSADRILAEGRMSAAGLAMPATVVTSDDVSRGKPDPEGYLKAAALLGADPADVVVFEDAPAGVAAARAAGMRTVVVGGAAVELEDGMWRIPDFASVTASVQSSNGLPGMISFHW
jgi:mannitol-1-/sugar-/sorbitol-6-phosphatase